MQRRSVGDKMEGWWDDIAALRWEVRLANCNASTASRGNSRHKKFKKKNPPAIIDSFFLPSVCPIFFFFSSMTTHFPPPPLYLRHFNRRYGPAPCRFF